MPKAAFCGQPHSESEVYCVKVTAIGLAPCRSQSAYHWADRPQFPVGGATGVR